MVMIAGPNYAISNQVPKSTTQFQRKNSVSQSYNLWWLSEDHQRIPINLSFRCLVFNLNSIPPREYWTRIHHRKFQEVVNHQSSYQGIKHSRTPWKTQLVHTGIIQTACMALAHLGQFIFHCGNSRHTVHFSRWADLC
ncbi:hypothetical protein O181_078372 [Austropuccinia psidii MF-1]|uniref:Uncharacterized protein n=1 Tax=Austropuccinia psidii MF-1 TaxID=1389203 RepID=A0A9Q3FHQ1_9BASI|nr:hypothetical protein [Austropuccinia psidii MF-1]